jgi:hypothetical protein
VQKHANAHLDETGWREGGQRAWLWMAVTTWVTVFLVRLSRGGKVAHDLLGTAFDGILIPDHFSAYTWYPVRWRRLCWAHLLRDIEAMSGRGGRSKEIGEALRDRALRPGVLGRKGSFGTQSVQGWRFVEAMMTVVATLKQQHRHPLPHGRVRGGVAR